VQGLCWVGGGGSCKARCKQTGEFQAVEVWQLLEGGDDHVSVGIGCDEMLHMGVNLYPVFLLQFLSLLQLSITTHWF